MGLLAATVVAVCAAASAQPPQPGNAPSGWQAEPAPPGGPAGPMPPRPAPGGPDAPPGTDSVSARQLVQEIMTARLARELALSDEQTVIMLKRFTEYRSQLDAFKKERQELTKALRASISGKEPDTKIEARLKALAELDGKIVEFKKSLYDSASEGLSVAQRAKLYVFLSDFESDMRKLIQKAREQSGQRMMNHGASPPLGGYPPGQPPRGIRNRMGPPGPPTANRTEPEVR